MKNIFALSALLIVGIAQAGESLVGPCLQRTKDISVESCLECTRDVSAVCTPVGIFLGGVILCCGETADIDLQEKSMPNRGGNPWEHQFEKNIEGPEHTIDNWAPLAAKVCCALPALGYFSAFTALKIYQCCNEKRD